MGIRFSCLSLFRPGHFLPARRDAAAAGDVALMGRKSKRVYACSTVRAVMILHEI